MSCGSPEPHNYLSHWMTDFVAIEVVPSSVPADLGFFEQLRLSVATVLQPRWIQFCHGFDRHPVTSIFLASLGSLAFFPIIAACTLSLFSIVFIACATVFAGFFLVIVFQLLIAISLLVSLACLTLLASGVTASLVTTVVAGQKAIVLVAQLQERRRDFDWPTVLHNTSASFTALTPQVVLDEVSNASQFLVSIPSRNLTAAVSDLARVIRRPQYPFLALPRFPPVSHPTIITNSDPDNSRYHRLGIHLSFLSSIYSYAHPLIASTTYIVHCLHPHLVDFVKFLVHVVRNVVNYISEAYKQLQSRGTWTGLSSDKNPKKDGGGVNVDNAAAVKSLREKGGGQWWT